MLIGVINQKGGVGKTTLAVHLAVWIYERGATVAFVDADSQGSSSEWIAVAQPEIDIYRCLDSDEIFATTAKLRAKYDVIVFDGPGHLSDGTKAIMALADGVMIPVQPSVLDTNALVKTLQVVQEIQETRLDEEGLPVVRIIPNKLKRRYKLSHQLLNAIEEADVAGSSGLSDLQAFGEAPAFGTVVWRMKSNAKQATQQMNKLFEEILNDESTIESKKS